MSILVGVPDGPGTPVGVKERLTGSGEGGGSRVIDRSSRVCPPSEVLLRKSLVLQWPKYTRPYRNRPRPRPAVAKKGIRDIILTSRFLVVCPTLRSPCDRIPHLYATTLFLRLRGL